MLFIGAEEAGRLSVLSVTEGQEVRPGDLLFTVDQTTQVADYEAAKAALAEAQAKLARVEENIGATELGLSPKELGEIDGIVKRVDVQGGRYPEHIEKMTGL